MHSLFSVILLTVHMMLALALIGVVLLQRSEGGLGGLGGGGGSGFMTARGSANLLTKTTRWLAGIFMATSLVLAWIAVHEHVSKSAFIPDTPPVEAPADQTGGAAGNSAPATGTGSTTGTQPTTGTAPAPTTGTAPAPTTGTAPSAPAVPTNQ